MLQLPQIKILKTTDIVYVYIYIYIHTHSLTHTEMQVQTVLHYTYIYGMLFTTQLQKIKYKLHIPSGKKPGCAPDFYSGASNSCASYHFFIFHSYFGASPPPIPAPLFFSSLTLVDPIPAPTFILFSPHIHKAQAPAT